MRFGNERGQTLPLQVMFMAVLIGFCSLAVDVGQWYTTRAQLQSAADAAALAGASQLPSGFGTAYSTAQANYHINGQASDTVSYTQATSSLGSPNDTIQVTATRNNPTFLAEIFGIGSVDISATAQATIETVTTATDADSIMPWGVMQDSFTYGQTVSLFGGLDQTGNFGAIDLPNGPPSCGISPGASSYRGNIDGTQTICDVSIGDHLPTETGQMTGPTKQGLDSRIDTNTDTFDQVVDTTNGQAQILKPSPRLVLVPIITNTDGTTDWPNGKKDIVVVGFAQFFISSYDGKHVTGQFIQNITTPNGTGSAYQPQSTYTTIALTG